MTDQRTYQISWPRATRLTADQVISRCRDAIANGEFGRDEVDLTDPDDCAGKLHNYGTITLA